MTNRRQFIVSSAASTLITGLGLQNGVQAMFAQRPKILLRSSWQVVNIGDIAHTPGVLALIEKHIPEAEVRLWASNDLTEEVMQMEHHRFPKLKIVKGSINEAGKATNSDLQETLDWCDFFLHGSGPSLVAAKDLTAFDKHFRKPFGIYGITYGGAPADQVELMSRAKFVFFRDSVSLAKGKADGIQSPIMEFGPDGAFACDLRNDAIADQWLAENDLKPGQFACCIPRLRYTPYWLIRKGTTLDEKKQARNLQMAEHDLAPLREAIIKVVKETSLKILLCPEDKSQMQVGKDWVYDKLPDDVRSRVVWRENFWLTDQALSTYTRSAGLFGLEMHSPIMCIGNSVPAIVGRFEEQTSKGFMWQDIELGDWLFDFDDDHQIKRYPSAVVEMLTNRARALDMVSKAQAIVHERQSKTMRDVAKACA